GGQYSMGDVTDRPSPTVDTNPRLFVEMETDISRYAIGAEWDKLKPGEQSAKYFSCVKVDPERPCNSIMASSGNFPSAAQPLHPTEKRKFTIAELKRICAFPDDFILTGSYAQQWERLGRSVPPVMMAAIASEIRREILDKCAEL
ncbi:MAG: DNA cytosine methyltransferase, partial [Verrucomicrobia bacterium]|nr:DNA cytosine methyltransferase [Verrucomicrobiota bacterium]